MSLISSVNIRTEQGKKEITYLFPGKNYYKVRDKQK